jgi:hypothetical protein
MRLNLHIWKKGTALYAGAYDVKDAESFGKACADAWRVIERRQFESETSIGALMEHLDNTVLDALDGSTISISRG